MRPAPLRALAALALVAIAAPALAQTAPPAPDGHRLFLAPTARPIPGGAGQAGVVMLVVPTGAVGLGEGVSLGAGVVTLTGAVLVEPKWTFVDRPGLAVAVGAALQANPNRYADAYALPYLAATATRDGVGVTLGVGGRASLQSRGLRGEPLYDIVVTGCAPDGPCSDDAPARALDEPVRTERRRAVHLVRAPAGFAGVEVRLSPRVTLLAEATAVPSQAVYDELVGGDAVVRRTGAVRYFLEGGAGARLALGRAALDLGLVATSDDDGSTTVRGVAPWLGLTVGFGR